MAIVEFRNAYYRGWFAARAHRPAPEPEMLEEHFFIDMGFEAGKISSGGPLEPWNRRIDPRMPANLDIEVEPDGPVFSTRTRQESMMSPRERPMPEHGYAYDEANVPTLESVFGASPDIEAEEEDNGTPEAQEEKRNRQLPEKKPSFKLPSRPAYATGKRRPARYAR